VRTEVESYLRTSDGRFTPIAEARSAPDSPRHVEGALMLKISNVAVLDTTLWDYIDELWAYIAGMVCSLSEKDEASTYFPDQVVKLTFRRQLHNRILVSVEMAGDFRAASADEPDLVSELQSKGSMFFARMSGLLPENRSGYDDALARLMSYRK
jgi:hypothetical protein